jgi:hypothetical protein
MAGSFPNTMDPSRAATPHSSAIQASRRPKVLFWILVASLLPFMVTASVDFGVTWDEFDRHKNGVAILEYFQGKSTREQAHYGTMYPGLFDVIPAWLERHYTVDRYILRHKVNAVFGWIGILFAGLLAGRLFGPWSGILAVVLLAASPRYFAHSMNNPKDLPFAAMGVVVLYGLSRLSSRWPYLTVGTGAALAVALGLALGTRPGALLYFGYLPLLLLAILIVQWISVARRTAVWIPRIHWTAPVQLVARVSLVIVAGLLVGTIFWPWAQAEPFTRPFEALNRAAGYDWDGLVLFDGRRGPASELPSSYLPTWFLITTPPVVLAGMVLSILAPVRGWGWQRVALWSAALLPIALIIARKSMVYDGMRHVLFAYPPMAVLAASGWAALLTYRQRWLRVGGLALLLAGLANVLAFDVRSHPNEAAYINELAGGPAGAFGRYELDYWGNCVLQAVEWSAATARRTMVPVRVWGRPDHLVEINAARFPELTVTPDGDAPHHLEIRLLRGSVRELWSLATHPGAVHRVTTADGAVLCVVSPGPQFKELERRLPASSRPPS